MEPPTLVISTVLSAMAYNHPPEKLSVYVSDDGGSEFTFYALLEASRFSKHWIPFCKKFDIEPRAPEAYFSLQYSSLQDSKFAQEWLAIKILIAGRDTSVVDNDGNRLPTLVYMSREKRPKWPHNFKAGAVNALIRVSSEITNAPFILNLDCDMYSNNADTIQEMLCFFMDEKKGDEFAFVQFPQYYNNLTKNDIYANRCLVTAEVIHPGLGGYSAALYCGTGCFHRRDSLCGRKYFRGDRVQWNIESEKNAERTTGDLEESSKVLASCSYEKGTQWGKEVILYLPL
ncbi:Cellulose synthase [Trema orientale]|uniref:Cellulose synthase n=1 Tax=Trema orientale TaxID=63057 RepID=A0A2P5ELB9_TREOI|nr:Cellulose synthase [Trema orientale]